MILDLYVLSNEQDQGDSCRVSRDQSLWFCSWFPETRTLRTKAGEIRTGDWTWLTGSNGMSWKGLKMTTYTQSTRAQRRDHSRFWASGVCPVSS